MDITPRKRAKIVTLRDHTTMPQRKITKSVGLSLGSVSSIFKQKMLKSKEKEMLKSKEKEGMEEKEKLPNVMI